MKKFWLTATLILTVTSATMLSTATPVPAQAAQRHYTTVPKKLRGHWRIYNKSFHRYDKQIFTKWESKNIIPGTKTNWFVLSGRSFKYATKSNNWNSDLLIKKVGKGYRVSPSYGSYQNDWAVWTRVKHHGKTALHATYPGAIIKSPGAYLYRYK